MVKTLHYPTGILLTSTEPVAIGLCWFFPTLPPALPLLRLPPVFGFVALFADIQLVRCVLPYCTATCRTTYQFPIVSPRLFFTPLYYALMYYRDDRLLLPLFLRTFFATIQFLLFLILCLIAWRARYFCSPVYSYHLPLHACPPAPYPIPHSGGLPPCTPAHQLGMPFIVWPVLCHHYLPFTHATTVILPCLPIIDCVCPSWCIGVFIICCVVGRKHEMPPQEEKA